MNTDRRTIEKFLYRVCFPFAMVSIVLIPWGFMLLIWMFTLSATKSPCRDPSHAWQTHTAKSSTKNIDCSIILWHHCHRNIFNVVHLLGRHYKFNRIWERRVISFRNWPLIYIFPIGSNFPFSIFLSLFDIVFYRFPQFNFLGNIFSSHY